MWRRLCRNPDGRRRRASPFSRASGPPKFETCGGHFAPFRLTGPRGRAWGPALPHAVTILGVQLPPGGGGMSTFPGSELGVAPSCSSAP